MACEHDDSMITPPLGIWQSILFTCVQMGIDVPTALDAADTALERYRSKFEDKQPEEGE